MYSSLTMKKLKSNTWWQTSYGRQNIFAVITIYSPLLFASYRAFKIEMIIIMFDYFLPVWTFFTYSMNEEIKSPDAHLFISVCSYIRLNCQFIIFLHQNFLWDIVPLRSAITYYYILLPTRFWRFTRHVIVISVFD